MLEGRPVGTVGRGVTAVWQSSSSCRVLMSSQKRRLLRVLPTRAGLVMGSSGGRIRMSFSSCRTAGEVMREHRVPLLPPARACAAARFATALLSESRSRCNVTGWR